MEAHGISSGPFGTTQKRFQDGYFSPRQGPGPATYKTIIPEQQDPTLLNSRPRTFGSRIGFRTSTARFGQAAHTNPHVNLLGEQNEPKGQFYEGEEQWVKQTRALDADMFNRNKIGFDTTSPRFNHHVVKDYIEKQLPGPATYKPSSEVVGTPKGELNTATKPFLSTSKKFSKFESYRPRTGTTKNIGPGVYQTEQNSLVKRSFNLTIENSFWF